MNPYRMTKHSLLRLNSWVNRKTIPIWAEPYQRRYMMGANQLFFSFIAIILLNSLVVPLVPAERAQFLLPRIITGIFFLILYPVFIKFKFINFARFYLTLILPLATYYGPLLSGNYGVEFYIKGSYQPLVCLLFTLWALHPKKDAKLFWTSISFHAPFSALTPLIGEYVKPGSILEDIANYPLAFTVTPAIFYGASLYVGLQIMNSKENNLDSMSSTNAMMLKVIEENETIQYQLQNELKSFDNKFQEVLLTNSHDLRLPVSNLIGLINIIENEKNNGAVVIPEHLLAHLKKSIQSLDENLTRVNDSLDPNK